MDRSILEKKFGVVRTGGKGTIRRKKIKKPKLRRTEDDNLISETSQSLTTCQKRINEFIKPENREDVHSYLHLFKNEFCRNISKGHRKSNRPTVDTYTTIRENLSSMLDIENSKSDNSNDEYQFGEKLMEYATKHLSYEAIEQLKGLLEIYINILSRDESEGFSKTKHKNLSDSELLESYKKMGLDFSNLHTPISIREAYIEKVNTSKLGKQGDIERNKLKKHYFSILKLYSVESDNESDEESDDKKTLESELQKSLSNINNV